MKLLPTLLAVLALCCACSTMRPVSKQTATTGVGVAVFPAGHRASAPRLSGTTLSGRPFDLAPLLGHGIVGVNVWASWCEPCRKEMPLLAKASGTSLRMIGIDENDRPQAARAFARSSGATYPMVQDPDGRMLHQLRVLPQTGVPSTVFIDARGRVAARVIGPIDERQLRLVLTRIGAGS